MSTKRRKKSNFSTSVEVLLTRVTGWKLIVKKYRDKSIFDKRKVENNAIDY